MPTRIEPNPGAWRSRIGKPCIDPEHSPPMHIVIPPGHRLVHTCPSCGKETIAYAAAEVTFHV